MSKPDAEVISPSSTKYASKPLIVLRKEEVSTYEVQYSPPVAL